VGKPQNLTRLRSVKLAALSACLQNVAGVTPTPKPQASQWTSADQWGHKTIDEFCYEGTRAHSHGRAGCRAERHPLDGRRGWRRDHPPPA